MCAVSNVGDYYTPRFQPYVQPQGQGGALGGSSGQLVISNISRAEFDQLKAEVLEMKQLLIKAKEIDAKTGQPDCEMKSKVKLLKQIAGLVGVDLSEVFPKAESERV